MSITPEDEEHQSRIKRLKYRANHRGIKEMDIVIGGFANDRLDALEISDVDAFEKLMNEHDRDLIVWVTGEAEFPIDDLRPIFEMVCAHANQTFQAKYG